MVEFFKFNPGAKRNRDSAQSEHKVFRSERTAVHLYKLGLFESSHPVFSDYMSVFSCYKKALAKFVRQ